MTFDDYEEALNEKVPERISLFREKAKNLNIGDGFKYLDHTRDLDTIWLVISIDHYDKVVKAVRWIERYEFPIIYQFSFSAEIIKYKVPE
jgi:hypothetical protein